MSDPTSELSLEELPNPPLYRFVDQEGQDVYPETGVGGEPASIGVLLAREESSPPAPPSMGWTSSSG